MDYEINPPASGKGVGRHSGKLVPSIAHLVGSRTIASLDADQLDTLADAVSTSTAVGYLAMAGIEVDMSLPERPVQVDTRQIWNLWVVRLNGQALDQVGLPRSVQDDVTNGAAAYFTNKLREADLLPKVHKRTRYRFVGKWYGQAGMSLRLLQAAELDPSEDLWQATNSWPFDRDD